LIAAACAAAPARAADPAPVIAAERAFAADGAANGVKASFLRWMADDAILFAPDRAPAREVYGKLPDGKGAHTLEWRPAFAGMAQSATLGFTTGPYFVDGQPRGHYFTVWRREADGGWKWIFDGGVVDDAANAPAPEAPVRALAPASGKVGGVGLGLAGGMMAERLLAQAARTDARAAYLARLAPDARVQGSPAPPADGREAIAREIATRPAQIDFVVVGGQAARTSDLVFTYGDARWRDAGKDRRGHYVRIWRQDRDGYRIVFDELIPVPDQAK
jgi:ketosteroid isomerase-like protein